MLIPPTRPMTFEDWQVLGCAIFLLGISFVGFALYTLTRAGADRSAALQVLGNGIAVCAVAGAFWFLLRRWLDG